MNGAGKTTLFKIITGGLQQDSGGVFLSKGLKLGHLEQNSGLESDNTIWAEMLTPYSTLISMEARLKDLEKRISLEKRRGAHPFHGGGNTMRCWKGIRGKAGTNITAGSEECSEDWGF